MHTGPVPGDFTESGRMVDVPCRKCPAAQVHEREWDSSDGAYTDWKYTCTACGHAWWIEGSDA